MDQQGRQPENGLATPHLEIADTRILPPEPPCLSPGIALLLGAIVGAGGALLAVLGRQLPAGLTVVLGGILGAIFFRLWFSLTKAQKKQLRENAKKWKARPDCARKTRMCGEAIDWVKTQGRFHPVGSGKGFDKAMEVDNGSIAAAFRLEKLLGLLGQESSFGTNFGESGSYIGPFQLSKAVVDDYNKYHEPDVSWPDDVDGAEDFERAAKVAAWYLAYLLQQFTFRYPDEGLGPISDPDEANKFALAAYNGGFETIKQARKKAKDAGKDPNKWEDVKDFLPEDTDQEKKKATEIREYVDKIREYEKLARELGCVPESQ